MKPHTWIHGEDKNTGYREGKQNGSLWPKTQSFQPGTFWLPGILVNKSIPLLKIITEDSPERKVAAPLCPASPTCPPPPLPSRRSVWARAQLEISAVSRLWFSNQQEESSGDIPPVDYLDYDVSQPEAVSLIFPGPGTACLEQPAPREEL